MPLSQLFLPGWAENQAEDRLVEDGGTVHVSLEAFPAVRLLAQQGDEVRITGRDVSLDLEEAGSRVWRELDGFDDVRVGLADSRAGPVEIERLQLDRTGSAGLYRLRLRGSVSASGLAEYAAGELGASLGNLVDGEAGGTPFELDLQVESDDGRSRIVGGGGTVAGFPADLVVDAVTGGLAGPL